MEQEKYIEITLIKSSEGQNPIIKKVLHSINTYLLKNKGAVSDFNLIKDVVDRNTDALDEEINNLLPIPLYLGLVGTMIGIVIGLFNMESFADPAANFNGSIDTLIGGVKIAMIASFAGLLFTIILSGWAYKGAKTTAENLKNDFFTWIQTNLLPVLSQNTSSSIYALQSNLLKFNDTFSNNVQNFSGLMDKILDSFDSQVSLMNDLKDIDVAKLAKLNVNVLKELRTSTKEFEKFNVYLTQMNLFVDNAQKLNFNLSSQLNRTHSIEKIAEAIGTNIEVNKNMATVLQSELQEISVRKQFVQDAVIDVDNSIGKMLDKLKENMEIQVDAINELINKQIETMNRFTEHQFEAIKDLTDKKLSEIKEMPTDIETILQKLLTSQREQNTQVVDFDASELKESLSLVKQEGAQQNQRLDTLISLLRDQNELNKTSSFSFSSKNLLSKIGILLGGVTFIVTFIFMLLKLLNTYF